MILLYPIGIPLLFAAVLLKRREKINPQLPTLLEGDRSVSATISSDTAQTECSSGDTNRPGTIHNRGVDVEASWVVAGTSMTPARGGDRSNSVLPDSETGRRRVLGSSGGNSSSSESSKDKILREHDGRRAALALRVNAAMHREKVSNIINRCRVDYVRRSQGELKKILAYAGKDRKLQTNAKRISNQHPVFGLAVLLFSGFRIETQVPYLCHHGLVVYLYLRDKYENNNNATSATRLLHLTAPLSASARLRASHHRRVIRCRGLEASCFLSVVTRTATTHSAPSPPVSTMFHKSDIASVCAGCLTQIAAPLYG